MALVAEMFQGFPYQLHVGTRAWLHEFEYMTIIEIGIVFVCEGVDGCGSDGLLRALNEGFEIRRNVLLGAHFD